MQLQNCFCQNIELFCIFLPKSTSLHLHFIFMYQYYLILLGFDTCITATCNMKFQCYIISFQLIILNHFLQLQKPFLWVGVVGGEEGLGSISFSLNGFCYSIALYIITFILFMVSRSCSSWWADDKASSRMSVSFMSLSLSCFFNSSTEEASSASYKLSIGIIMLYTSFYPHAFHSFCSFSQNLFQMIVLLASSHKETSHSWNNLGSMLLANENAGALCLTQLLHDNHWEAIALWLRQLLTRSILYLRTRGVGALDKALTIWHVDL